MMTVAVVVTTYNRPDALASVLEGFIGQADRTFELIVADDGSADETARVVSTCAGRAPFPVRHVWQEDRGFRAAAIRNRAIAATTAEYIVFVDGDCVPRPGFVEAHRKLSRRGWFLYGHRVLIGKALTERVLGERLPVHTWGFDRWAAARLRGGINRLTPLLPWPAKLSWTHGSWRGIKTCNLSTWRTDLLRVNGFDEDYTGWGLEDSDLVVRLMRAGVSCRNARGTPPVLHLWHPENPRATDGANEARLRERLRSETLRAEHGVEQYL